MRPHCHEVGRPRPRAKCSWIRAQGSTVPGLRWPPRTHRLSSMAVGAEPRPSANRRQDRSPHDLRRCPRGPRCPWIRHLAGLAHCLNPPAPVSAGGGSALPLAAGVRLESFSPGPAVSLPAALLPTPPPDARGAVCALAVHARSVYDAVDLDAHPCLHVTRGACPWGVTHGLKRRKRR